MNPAPNSFIPQFVVAVRRKRDDLNLKGQPMLYPRHARRGLNMKGVLIRSRQPKMAAHVLRKFWAK